MAILHDVHSMVGSIILLGNNINMKTLRIFEMALVAIIIGVSLTSCSKDISDGEKRLTRISVKWGENVTEKFMFHYNDNGRLIEASDIYEKEDYTRNETYMFSWKDDIVKVVIKEISTSDIDEDSNKNITITLDNGLVQKYDDDIFSYNESGRFTQQHEDQTVIWSNDKIMFTSDPDNEVSYTYNEVCKKGYLPVALMMLEFPCNVLYIAHPEIIGVKTTQLPATETWTSKILPEYKNMTSTYSYEFNTDGYITKINRKNYDGQITMFTLTWE